MVSRTEQIFSSSSPSVSGNRDLLRKPSNLNTLILALRLFKGALNVLGLDSLLPRTGHSLYATKNDYTSSSRKKAIQRQLPECPKLGMSVWVISEHIALRQRRRFSSNIPRLKHATSVAWGIASILGMGCSQTRRP